MEAPVTFRPLIDAIPKVASKLSFADYLGAVKVRWNIGRDHYTVEPGLYKIGHPDQLSDVLVSANYKLSFDVLRKNLKDLNAWILVIDTKGINVWCAAGKGTFGTDILVRSIRETQLGDLVKHRRIILPQLGAPGVAAHIVKELTGFRVLYGPVRANDIPSFLQAGYKATPEMRKVKFSFFDRAKLIPVDLVQGKYRILTAVALLFILSGLDRTGFLFGKMWQTSPVPLISITSAYLAGVALAPLFLPYIPFRAFALKGAFWGMASTLVIAALFKTAILETVALGAISVSIASFMTMNFTGSSTYTSLSGVKKEMKIALPFQIALASLGIILFITSKLI
jgi:hypothetical protein